MIINEQLFELEDQCDALTASIMDSKTVKDYRAGWQKMTQCPETEKLKHEFARLKTVFEDIEGLGSYAPGYKETEKALRQAKRALDLNENVASFRITETRLQELLDEIVLRIAGTISENIKVDAGNPFFETGSNSGCGGICHEH